MDAAGSNYQICSVPGTIRECDGSSFWILSWLGPLMRLQLFSPGIRVYSSQHTMSTTLDARLILTGFPPAPSSVARSLSSLCRSTRCEEYHGLPYLPAK